MGMKYSCFGSCDLCSWESAAKRGGTTPESPSPGEPRYYNVDAWLEVDGQDPVRVTGVWMSELQEDLKKALLKELGLPVKKGLIYKGIDGVATRVIDIKITDVWDGWCNVAVRLEDGTSPCAKIHSMHFAEMNSGSSSTGHQEPSVKPPAKKLERSKKKQEIPGMPLDYFVFDIESTDKNYRASEICEIAALKICDGKVVDKFETLVFIDGDICETAAEKNHISKDMLQDAPHMTTALNAFLRFIGTDAVLVGHNIKTFDLPFIGRVADLCGVKFSYREAIDTLTLAKRAWPGLASHKMDDLRTRLDLELDGGHRALKDCFDEYELYMRIRKDVEEGRATVAPPKKETSRTGAKWSGKWERKKARDFSTERTEFDKRHPLFGKYVVISGEVDGIDYNDCMQIICDFGGHPQDNVTKATNYLVVGENPGKGKLAKAQEYKERGLSIEIIDAGTFIEMIG